MQEKETADSVARFTGSFRSAAGRLIRYSLRLFHQGVSLFAHLGLIRSISTYPFHSYDDQRTIKFRCTALWQSRGGSNFIYNIILCLR